MDVFAAFIAPALAGVFVGVMSGLLGVGGGTIMVPIFRLAFGMSPLASTATSLFAIIPTSISGVVAHTRAKTCVPKLGLALGVAVVIGFSAFKMFKKAVKCAPTPRAGRAGGNAQGASAKAMPDQPVLSRKQYLQGACIGLIAGLASGYVGVGGGFIMVPLMLAVLDIPMSLASGTSLIAIMILAIPGVIEQGLLGNIEYRRPGGRAAGARGARAATAVHLRRLFAGGGRHAHAQRIRYTGLTPHAGLFGLPVVPDKEGVGV